MDKQFLGGLITAHKFLFFICAMVCTPLYGMDVNSMDNHPLREIVIANADRRLQCILAVLNRAYNKIIEGDHRPDKKHIEQFMQKEGTPLIRGQVSWNKDFNQCAWFVIGEPASILKTLAITLVSLDDKKDVVIAKGSWNNYMKPIIDDTLCLYFNKERAVCCYGYGWIKVSDDFLEYSLTCSGLAAAKECVVKVDDNGAECDLNEVAGIPAVMKSFLQSPYIYEHMGSGEIIKVHKLRDVIMPEEYKKFATAKYWYDCALHNTYQGC